MRGLGTPGKPALSETGLLHGVLECEMPDTVEHALRGSVCRAWCAVGWVEKDRRYITHIGEGCIYCSTFQGCAPLAGVEVSSTTEERGKPKSQFTVSVRHSSSHAGLAQARCTDAWWLHGATLPGLATNLI